jgi:hypothetical protein
MATRDSKVTETTTQVSTDRSAVSTTTDVKVWHRLALGVVLLIADFLNFYRLKQVGYGNAYYAAAVKSMLMNWHNFFFVSFDPSGFVTIDKPPLGFWIQVLSAKLFGFSGLSLLLPHSTGGWALSASSGCTCGDTANLASAPRYGSRSRHGNASLAYRSNSLVCHFSNAWKQFLDSDCRAASAK